MKYVGGLNVAQKCQTMTGIEAGANKTSHTAVNGEGGVGSVCAPPRGKELATLLIELHVAEWFGLLVWQLGRLPRRTLHRYRWAWAVF